MSMFDCDVIIIGGGPAGLTAGIYLSRGRRQTILLEKETFGGPMMNYELIENYPGFANGVSGAELASEMISQATKYGLQLKRAEVVGVELSKSCLRVRCADGAYVSKAVIIAGGSRLKKLGVPGEEEYQGKGIFNCAFCDGDQFVDQVVAVCGGGDAGITETLYMTKLASKVLLIEVQPMLTATAILQERAYANPKMEIYCGTKIEAIREGKDTKVLDLLSVEKGERFTLAVDGILVHVGVEANTDYLKGILSLDNEGQIIVNDRMETKVKGVFAAGDIRSGSPRQIVSAVGDGATAAISAEKFLQELA